MSADIVDRLKDRLGGPHDGVQINNIEGDLREAIQTIEDLRAKVEEAEWEKYWDDGGRGA